MTEQNIELCHCGRPIFINDAIEPGFTRGLCEDCDSVRCDAYPGECETDSERTIRATMKLLLDRWHSNATQMIRNSPEGFCRVYADDLYQAGALAPVRPQRPAERRESWVTLTETCEGCGAELSIDGTAHQVNAMSIVFRTHHNEQTCAPKGSNILYSSSGSIGGRIQMDKSNIKEL
ncbi:MAG TPA: hypothetical protein VHK27_06100 [Gammaproteobacteria bacterium]|nr:hypothetical protein [Gammaproteobacteria bacterium]